MTASPVESFSDAVAGFDLVETSQLFDGLSTQRSLLLAPAEAEYRDQLTQLVRLALFSELSLDDLGGRVPTEELNAVAHAFSQGLDLLRGSLIDRLDHAELAASLFSAAEQTPKAFAVTQAFLPLTSALSRAAGSSAPTFHAQLSSLVTALIRRDLKNLVRYASQLANAARQEHLDRDDARLALVLNEFVLQLERIVRGPARPEDLRTIGPKLRLARTIAQRGGDAMALATVQRMLSSTRTLLSNSTRIVLDDARVQLPADYLSELTGTGSRHPILELWPPQREAVESDLLLGESHVVSMPTSAGKTLVAELAIARVLGQRDEALAVYVAPYTALAQQVSEHLSERLSPAGLAEPQVWTGTYEIDSTLESVGRVLVMTPEKLDAVLRSRLEDDPRAADLETRIRLVVLDECHLIGTDGRGLTYELLVSRLRKRFPHVQVCAMSAVLGNPDRLAHWLADDETKVVRSSWRPGNARIVVYQRDGSVLDQDGNQLLELGHWSVARLAAAAVTQALVESGEWPVLVMDSQRGYAEEAALQLLDLSTSWDDGDDAQERRTRAADIARALLGRESKLPDLLLAGIAFHHAGLPPVLRSEIEFLARHRFLRVVASTTTLAEGIDLPFRVVVCPHINYESGYMSRQLFQNVAGRAGRAFAGIEGWVVFLEPGTEKLTNHLWGTLLSQTAVPLSLTSWVSQIGRRIIKPDDWRRDWRYQSQLVGALADGLESNDQAATFIGSTFAAAAGESLQLRPAVRRGRALLSEMERQEPALALAASPYRLTLFGEAACLTGLSVDSVRILHRELQQTIREGVWSDPGSWSGQANDDLLNEIVRLSFSPLEALTTAIEMPGKYGDFSRIVSAWRDDGNREIMESLLQRDLPLVLEWLRGTDLGDLADNPPTPLPTSGPLRRNTSLERLLELNNYFSRIPGLLGWMYSGVVRIAEYLRDEEGIDLPDEIKLGVDYLTLGVSSPASRFLSLSIGLPRTAANRLPEHLDFSHEFLEESMTTALLESGRSAVTQIELDEWSARESDRIIRQLQPRP